MILNTAKFGEVEIEDDRIFDFVMPVIGFNDLTKFAILDFNNESVFKWLQSIENPSLAFPIVSVYSLDIDYSVDVPDNAVDLLKIDSVESLLVMNIASIPQDNPQGATINMLAPIIFNIDKLLAGQIILSGSGYEISFPMFKGGIEC